MTGNAKLVDPAYLMTADKIRFNQKTQVAVASGNVALTRVGDRILAEAHGNPLALLELPPVPLMMLVMPPVPDPYVIRCVITIPGLEGVSTALPARTLP